jgi:hypothetical protein
MKKVHPTEPHWYLFAIGSDPTVRGAGFGQALMHSRIDRCHAEHAPAYLEATKQETIPYYMRFGFEVTGEIEAPGGGPSMYPMWRTELRRAPVLGRVDHVQPPIPRERDGTGPLSRNRRRGWYAGRQRRAIALVGVGNTGAHTSGGEGQTGGDRRSSDQAR